ncbi:glycoside hydrolase family 16 protein [Atractiella rhizophila]|nr:glycoside hydrolase family 16 protein [Atractiella rhizophila]
MVVPKSLYLLSLLSYLEVASAACTCGYRDSNGAVWREAIEANFANNFNAAMSFFGAQDWGPVAHDNTTYLLKYDSANAYKTSGGLALKTNAYDQSQGTTGVVHSAELDSIRGDFLYGTFRVRARVPTVPGVCFGFFTYRQTDDLKVYESDIELLTSDGNFKQTVHYTNQPGLVNGDTDPDAYREVTVSGADFSTMTDHRFDWIPGNVKFYVNGAQTTNIAKNTPTVASQILMNLWSDGGEGWTQGPPTADAIAVVEYVNMYFNSTTMDEAAFKRQCNGNPTAVCNI